MIIHKDITQHSEEWYEIRKGKITGSILKDLITPKEFRLSKGQSVQRAMAKLIAKQIITQDNEHLETYDIARGIANEPEARILYEKLTHNKVQEVGFISSDCSKFGFSPDGLVDGGFIEIKCPRHENFILTILTAFDHMLINDGYLLQVLFGFLIYKEAEFCDFMVYNADMPINNRLFIKRINKVAYKQELEKLEIAVNELAELFHVTTRKFIENSWDYSKYETLTIMPF